MRRTDPVAPDVWVFSPGLWFGAFGKLDRPLYKEVLARVLRDAEAYRNTTAFYMRTVSPYAVRRGQIDDDHQWMYHYGRKAFPEQSRVVDAWQVLSPRKGELAMPDGVHYSGVGSKTLTNLLLNMLCR